MKATGRWIPHAGRAGVYARHRLLRDRDGNPKRCPADVPTGQDASAGRCRCKASYRGQVWDADLKRSVNSRAYTNADEAAGWVADRKRGVAPHSVLAAGGLTVRDLIERFLQAASDGTALTRRESRYAPKSVYTYRISMRRHVYTDLIAGRDAAMLTPVDWHEFGKRMMAKPSLRGQSVAGFLLTVRRAYGWACRVDVGLLSTNPLLHVTLPRPEDRRAPQVVERATAAAMLDALDRDDLRVQWAIMFYAGLRIAEVCALDWPQVDFNRNVIVVLKSKSRAGVREVPMAAPLRTVLLRWQMQNHGAALGPITRGRRHLRIMSGDPARVAATRCWAGRFPVLHPHDARHTFASWLVAAGEDLANVSNWLGHANIAVTAHYVQTLPKPEGQPLTTSRFDAFLAEA